MIVKFLGNKGGGSAGATIDYLLGKDRDRPGAVLLSGDPELTQRLADNLDFQNRYTVGVLSFEETDLDQHQKEKIMQSFEETLLAGLQRDQYDITWIEHTDKGRLELNFVIPNVELSTGKRLQPYFDQADRPLVENWKQVTNFEHGLTDPHAPEKAQAIKTLNSQNLPQSIKEIKEKIGTAIAEQIGSGNIQNRQDVVETLKGAGFEIARETDRSISIKNPDGKRNIRLEGLIYENRQFDKQFAEEHRRAGQDYQRTSRERYDTALGKLQRLTESKQQGNRETFKVKPSNHPRPATENQKRFAFEYSHGSNFGRVDYSVSDISWRKLVVSEADQEQAAGISRNQSKSRSDTARETDLAQGTTTRERRQENPVHHGEEQQKSGSLRDYSQSNGTEIGKIESNFKTPFENPFNQSNDGIELLRDSGSLFENLATSKEAKQDVKQNNPNQAEQDNAKRLYESLQRVIRLVREAIERAKRYKSKSERADRNLELSESSIENSERGISQSKSAIKQSEQQITTAEQHIDVQIKLEQKSNKKDYGMER
ncbi:relaxase/mobilization nuclease domain-containing protein [Acinetobacter baumannii]|uniref:relaxase/mobilization nuclease domain-containing protein n=1 Tax=Acinetobacter baumannii TaxID=470 RepID=UPI0029499FB0|nr:relaxase/mobilization nuclease domain-containing protein [Acinetobacter baumannii]MDV5176013.1 relaxase/mobilization nuclease domain-containing protein [Acinetobacter baumannii]